MTGTSRLSHRPCPQAPRRGVRGVTLVELMVVLSVLAVVLALAAPSFTETLRSNRLTTQVNELVGAMQMARAEAVRRNTTVQYCARPADSRWTVSIKGGDELRRGDLAPGIQLSEHCVDFRADGIAYNPATGVVLTDTAAESRRQIALEGTTLKRFIYVNVASVYVAKE
ncbi:MAG TPA: GspH/FimT family pseudopilin [Burkholderiaceae bacterium]|nr:GspH/FimT family pseudopilin [Burkholderiaceae bacterium]